MSTRLSTNEGEKMLLKQFAGVFAANRTIEQCDALAGKAMTL